MDVNNSKLELHHIYNAARLAAMSIFIGVLPLGMSVNAKDLDANEHVIGARFSESKIIDLCRQQALRSQGMLISKEAYYLSPEDHFLMWPNRFYFENDSQYVIWRDHLTSNFERPLHVAECIVTTNVTFVRLKENRRYVERILRVEHAHVDDLKKILPMVLYISVRDQKATVFIRLEGNISTTQLESVHRSVIRVFGLPSLMLHARNDTWFADQNSFPNVFPFYAGDQPAPPDKDRWRAQPQGFCRGPSASPVCTVQR